MSLGGAMNSAVSGLMAMSEALSMISDNLANSSTTAYKETDASFSSLVTSSRSSSAGYSAGGVTVTGLQRVSQQGTIESTSTYTDLAIDGDGFFVVTDGLDGTSLYYTRDGEFDVDDDGYLVLENEYYLQGWATDDDGNVIGTESTSNLVAINISDVSSIAASATTEESITGNLPSDATVGATFQTTLTLYDSLGNEEDVTVSWTKTGTNTWTFTPDASSTLGTSTSTTTGTVTLEDSSGNTYSSVTITFNSDGSLASTDPSDMVLSISGYTTGAADSSITLDLGTVGDTDGLSQYASGEDTPNTDLTITKDGEASGTLSSVSITDGTVYATYTNGLTKAIYKISIATFNNADGLETMSNGIYAATSESGAASYYTSGESGAGTIESGALESSTVDESDQFTRMISAQQAYSACSQVISTVKDMYDDLMQAVR